MSSKSILFLMVFIMTLSGSLGALCFKQVTNDSKGSGNIKSILFNKWLIFGGALYCIGALLNIVLLKDLEYSIVYPITALTYVWTLLISRLFLGEKIKPHKVFGVLSIILGVIVLTL